MISQMIRGLVVGLATCTSVLSLYDGEKVNAAIPDVDCVDTIRVIFVRGSGQEIETSKEYTTLKSKLQNMNIAKSLEFVDLQNTLTELSKEEPYKAIPVAGDPKAFASGALAVISSARFGEYRESLKSGENLLNKLLKINNDLRMCSVLVGYSQGAHVIGNVLANADDITKSRVLYVGLMGDPAYDNFGYFKLGHLPGSIVPWYRGDSWGMLQGGIITSRSPEYIPRIDDRTFTPSGSWCYEYDPICTGNLLGTVDDHGKYPERALPLMSLEIANAINNPSGEVTKQTYPAETCGPAKKDIVVLLDTSSLMRRDASLFSDTPMVDPYHETSYGLKLPPRTAGQMLTSSGCGDVRVAVVGYGSAASGEPKLLLDFTKDPAEYDTLMASLYQPSAGGKYERTQFREGALRAFDVPWRSDASRAVIAMTDMVGNGPSWDAIGSSASAIARTEYERDFLTQQVFETARKNDVMILGIPIEHGYGASTPVSDEYIGSARDYLNMFSAKTGGYNWNRAWPYYGPFNFKQSRLHTTVTEAFQRHEKTTLTAMPVKGKVGTPVTLRLNDDISLLAAAGLRSDNRSIDWYIDCGDNGRQQYHSLMEFSFTPTKAQKCTGAAIVSVREGSGAGCYYGCPEPFPPYMVRSFPFTIDIKPEDYVPKIPAQITNLQKIISDTQVSYNWDPPAYNGTEELVYVVREPDGAVLALTSSHQLIITETEGDDPDISIAAAGLDGQSTPTTSDQANLTLDTRMIEQPKVEVVTPLPGNVQLDNQDFEDSSREDDGVTVTPVSPVVESSDAPNATPRSPLLAIHSTTSERAGAEREYPDPLGLTDGSVLSKSAQAMPAAAASVSAESTAGSLNNDPVEKGLPYQWLAAITGMLVLFILFRTRKHT